MNIRARGRLIFVCGALLSSLLVAGALAKSSSTKPSKPKSNTVEGTAKSKTKLYKFAITDPNFTVSLSTDLDKKGGAVSGNIRISLMVEAVRDKDGSPVNWAPVKTLYQGQVPKDLTEDFSSGPIDGAKKWFALSIDGSSAHYSITITQAKSTTQPST